MTMRALSCPAPRIMSTMAFIIIIYLFFRLLPRYPIRSTTIIGIMSLYMGMVHHAQTVYILVIIALLLIGTIIFYKDQVIKKTKTIILSLGLILTTFIFGFKDEIKSVLDKRLFKQIESIIIPSSENTNNNHVGTETTIIEPVNIMDNNNMPSMEGGEVINQIVAQTSTNLFDVSYCYSTMLLLSSSIMIVLIFIGIYTLIVKLDHPKKISIILPLALITFIFFIPGVMDVFPIFSGAFQIYRFRFVPTIFFSIVMGSGLAILLNLHTKKRKLKIGRIVVVILCIGLIITSPFLGYSRDNEIFHQSDILVPYDEYFDESDMIMFKFVETYSDEVVYSERDYALYIIKSKITSRGGNYNLLKMFSTNNYTNERIKTILHPLPTEDRDEMRYSEGDFISTEPLFKSIKEYNPKIFMKNIHKYNKIYSENVVIYNKN